MPEERKQNGQHRPFLSKVVMAKLVSLRDNLNTLERLLAEHLPWTPFDYVPGISRQGDRELAAADLTSSKAPENDFRFEGAADDGSPVALLAECLPWDSEFFGYGVGRIHGVFPLAAPLVRPGFDYHRVFGKLLKRLRKEGLRYVTVQVDPRDLALLRAVGEAGFTLIETRYLHCGPVIEPVLGERLPIRRATEEDIPSLARAASQMINPYDRFHADPLIDPADAARLMERWVAESVAGRMADITIVPDVPEPGAFVTYRYHRDKWDRWKLNVVQGVLSAVSPEFVGWLGWLGPEVAYHLHRLGVQFACGSTQVTNNSIIWLAQDGGSRFGKCLHTFRISL
ncbi:MAG: hypothetical protein KF708_15425 [Pirellulales bacterium]|nr:hypothetical protein [Pirellulales bacterium]